MQKTLVATATLVLGACVNTPDVPTDSLPQLAPGQVMMGFTIDSRFPIQRLRLHRQGYDDEFVTLQGIAEGRSIRLLIVEPGTYCMDSLAPRSQAFRSMGTVRLKPDEDVCDIVVGDEPLNYIGHLRFREGGPAPLLSGDRPDFLEMLKEHYPLVYEEHVSD